MRSRILSRKPTQLTLTALAALVAGSLGASAYAATVASAARSANVAQVRQLISSGADVNTTEADGTSPLLWAAYQSSPELVAMLLKAGANPNVANNFGVTPLLQAARNGDAKTTQALLEGGANPDQALRDGETPLMAAARAGSADSINLLIKHGADVNATESVSDQTALMWATAEGHIAAVDALLKAGANPNLKARVSELTQRSTRTDFPTGGFTAVMWAVRDGNEPLVRRLVTGGADLKITNGDGATATMLAIINDRFDMAATLLDLGADPNDGALFHAVEMRDATTDWRAKDGSRLRSNHDNKLTALDLTKLLLEKGADPNKPFIGQMHSASMCCDTHANATPFYRAAVAADVEALKLMLAYKPDLEWTPKAVDGGPRNGPGTGNAGKTPLMVAMNGGKGVGMAGGPGDIREGNAPPFREVSNRSPVEAVKVLLAAGVNPNAKTPAGDTALHLAAWDGKLEIVRTLVEGGANINELDGAGKTALQVVSNQPPRPPAPTTGAQVPTDRPAQPADVAALLRELAQGKLQASAAGSR